MSVEFFMSSIWKILHPNNSRNILPTTVFRSKKFPLFRHILLSQLHNIKNNTYLLWRYHHIVMFAILKTFISVIIETSHNASIDIWIIILLASEKLRQLIGFFVLQNIFRKKILVNYSTLSQWIETLRTIWQWKYK